MDTLEGDRDNKMLRCWEILRCLASEERCVAQRCGHDNRGELGEAESLDLCVSTSCHRVIEEEEMMDRSAPNCPTEEELPGPQRPCLCTLSLRHPPTV